VFALRHFARQVHPRFGALRARRDRRLGAIRPSAANRIWFLQQLDHELITRLRTLGVDVAHELRNHWPPPKPAHDALDAKAPPKPKRSNPHEVTAAVNRARAKLPEHVARGIGVHVATKLVKKNLDTVDDKLSASIKRSLPGVDIRQGLVMHGPILGAMNEALEANVALITSIPPTYFDDLEDTISEAWDAGRSWTTMVEDVMHVGKVVQSRAELIARDQTGKMNADFNRVRQQSIGIERYEWMDSGIGPPRERESHEAMRGEICRWDDPPLVDDENVHPGEAINCMCVAAPYLDLDEPDEDTGEEPDAEEEDEIDAEEG
jgi:SPP1 gp7 family putative phage head morphogenesis protein